MGLYEKTLQFVEAGRQPFAKIVAALNRTLDAANTQEVLAAIQVSRETLAEVLLQRRMNPQIVVATADPSFVFPQQAWAMFQAELAKENVPPVTYLVFMYGTMKRGFPMNMHLDGQRFIAEAQTEPQYRMYVHKQGWFPCLVRDEHGLEIEGELWEVSEECLCQLDQAEGYMFSREMVPFPPPYEKEVIETYLYKFRPTKDFIDVGTCWQGPDDQGTCWQIGDNEEGEE